MNLLQKPKSRGIYEKIIRTLVYFFLSISAAFVSNGHKFSTYSVSSGVHRGPDQVYDSRKDAKKVITKTESFIPKSLQLKKAAEIKELKNKISNKGEKARSFGSDICRPQSKDTNDSQGQK